MDSNHTLRSPRTAREAAIAKIDAVVDRMRAAHPENYWRDTDPAYQSSKAGWAADRAALKAEKKGER